MSVSSSIPMQRDPLTIGRWPTRRVAGRRKATVRGAPRTIATIGVVIRRATRGLSSSAHWGGLRLGHVQRPPRILHRARLQAFRADDNGR